MSEKDGAEDMLEAVLMIDGLELSWYSKLSNLCSVFWKESFMLFAFFTNENGDPGGLIIAKICADESFASYKLLR